MRVLLANARSTAGAILLLGLAACGSAHNADLFRSSGNLGESGGSRSAGGADSTPDSGGANNRAGGAGASAGNPESSGGGGASGGDSNQPPPGGAASDAGAPANGGSPYGGSSGENSSECAEYGADASYFPGTQHCYLVVNDIDTYAAAQAHCKSLGAHLITLTDAAENDFAWGLHSDEHWIGSTDGRGPRQPGAGTYSWVTNEAFDYSNWSPDQPNAADTDCGDTGLTGHCYEHCAFQWKGGDQDGQWNDRFCLHTIAAICEWDSQH